MPFSPNATGVRYAGFKVNSTTYEGPAYSAVGASIQTSTVAVRVLDLNAGDTVAPICYQSSGGSLAIDNTNPPGYQPHFGMMYLCPYSTGGVQAFTPPLTSFHWYAGLPASSLLAYMDQHLGNDLNFLIHRPYFTGYQANAQSGLTDGSWNAVTIDTPSGLVHGNLGDNYGGWNPTQNMYVAQQPGWYLVIAEVYGNTPSAATAYMAAGINCPSSGGVNPSTSPDQYQTVFFPQTTGKTYPGALAIGMYYLAVGESVQPMIYANNWGGNYGTGVSGSPSVNSQLTVCWMAELALCDSLVALCSELDSPRRMPNVREDGLEVADRLAIDQGHRFDGHGPGGHHPSGLVREAERRPARRRARAYRAVCGYARGLNPQRALSTAILGIISAAWGAGITTVVLVICGGLR